MLGGIQNAPKKKISPSPASNAVLRAWHSYRHTFKYKNIYFITHWWLISITMVNQSLSVVDNLPSNDNKGILLIVDVPT